MLHTCLLDFYCIVHVDFVKQKTAYELLSGLVDSEMCISASSGSYSQEMMGLVLEYHFWSSHSLPQIITILPNFFQGTAFFGPGA